MAFAALGLRDSIKVFGTDYPTRDGTCIRDYIHVNDLANAHIKALEYLKLTSKSSSYNLGNGNGYSVLEVIDTVKKISNLNFHVIKTDRREGDPPVLVGSSQKARNELSWKPRYESLDEIIETAWNWHNSQKVKKESSHTHRRNN